MDTVLRSMGKYELRQRLASSHLNEVWVAQDSYSQRSVILKVFYTHHEVDSEVIRHFVSQAEAVASLHHPNLVRLLDVFVFPSKDPTSSVATIACLVTEYVAGQTLTDYLHSTSSATKMRPGADIVALFTPISMASSTEISSRAIFCSTAGPKHRIRSVNLC
jgi:serine/threonine protein kinase